MLSYKREGERGYFSDTIIVITQAGASTGNNSLLTRLQTNIHHGLFVLGSANANLPQKKVVVLTH